MLLCRLSRKRERHRFMGVMPKAEKRCKSCRNGTETLHCTRYYEPKHLCYGNKWHERSRWPRYRVSNESSLTNFAAVASAEFSDELYNNLYTNHDDNTSICSTPVKSTSTLTSTHLCHQINLPIMLKTLSLLKNRGALRREEYEHIRRCIDVHTYKSLLPWLWNTTNYLVISPTSKLIDANKYAHNWIKVQNNTPCLIQCSVHKSSIDKPSNNKNNTLLHSIEHLKVIAPHRWQSVITLQLSELCSLPTECQSKQMVSSLKKLLRAWQRVFYLIGNNHAFMAAESHEEFVNAHQSLMTVIDTFYQHVNKLIAEMQLRLENPSVSLYEQLCQINISTLSIMPPRLLLLWRRHYAVQSARQLHAELIKECIIREEALLNVIVQHHLQHKGNTGHSTNSNVHDNNSSNIVFNKCSPLDTHIDSNQVVCDNWKQSNKDKVVLLTSLLENTEIYSYLLWCAAYRGSGIDTANDKPNSENDERDCNVDDPTSWQALWSRLLACGSFIFPRLFYLHLTCTEKMQHDAFTTAITPCKDNNKMENKASSSPSSPSSSSKATTHTHMHHLHALFTHFFKCTVWVKNDNNEAARCVEVMRIIFESFLIAKQRQMQRINTNNEFDSKQTIWTKQMNERHELLTEKHNSELERLQENDVHYNNTSNEDCVDDESSIWSLISLARSVMMTQMQQKATQLRFRCGDGLFEMYTFAALLELFNPTEPTYFCRETNNMSLISNEACSSQRNKETCNQIPYAMLNVENNLQLLLRSLKLTSPSIVWRRLIQQCSTLSCDHHLHQHYFPLLRSVEFAINYTLPTLLPSLLQIDGASGTNRKMEMHELKVDAINQLVKWWEQITLPLQLGDSHVALYEYVKHITSSSELKNNNNKNLKSFCTLLNEIANNKKMSSPLMLELWETALPLRRKCIWKCGCSFANANNINIDQSSSNSTHFTMTEIEDSNTPPLHASPCLECSLSHKQPCWTCVECKHVNNMQLGNNELCLVYYPLCSCCGALHPENTKLIASEDYNTSTLHRPAVTTTTDNNSKHGESNISKLENIYNTSHAAHVCLTCNKMCEIMYNFTNLSEQHDSIKVNTKNLAHIVSNHNNSIIEKHKVSYNTPTRPFCLHDSNVQNGTNFFTSASAFQLQWLCGCGTINAITQLYCNKCSNVFINDSATEMTQPTNYSPRYTCNDCHKLISLTHSQKDSSRDCHATTDYCEINFNGGISSDDNRFVDSGTNALTHSHQYWNQLQRIRCPHCSVAHPRYDVFCKHTRVVMCPGCHLLVSWMPNNNINSFYIEKINMNTKNSEIKRNSNESMESKTTTEPCSSTIRTSHHVLHSENNSIYWQPEEYISECTKQTSFECPSCHYSCVGNVYEYMTSYVDAPWRCHACGHANNLREPHSGRLMNALRLQRQTPLLSLQSSLRSGREEIQQRTLTSEKNWKHTLQESFTHVSEMANSDTDVSEVKNFTERNELTVTQNSTILCEDNLPSPTHTLKETKNVNTSDGSAEFGPWMYENICETCASCHTERLPIDEFNEWTAWRCGVCAENHVNYGFACDYCFSLHPAFYTPLSPCTAPNFACKDTTNESQGMQGLCKADEVFVWRCCVCNDTLNPSWSSHCARLGCVGTLSMLSEHIHNSVPCSSTYMYTKGDNGNTPVLCKDIDNKCNELQELYKYQYEVRNCGNCGHYASPFQLDRYCKYCHEELLQLKPFVEVTIDNTASSFSEKREVSKELVYDTEKMTMNILNSLEVNATIETKIPPLPPLRKEESSSSPSPEPLLVASSKLCSHTNIHETIAVIKQQQQQQQENKSPLRLPSKLHQHYSSLVPPTISKNSSDYAKETLLSISSEEIPFVRRAESAHFLNIVEEKLLSAAKHVNTFNTTRHSKRKK